MESKLEKYSSILLNSFPKRLSNDVFTVLETIPSSGIKKLAYSKADRFLNVNIDSENIKIPYRIYCGEPNNTGNLSSLQKDILACIYSRHHNGFVRQKYIETLIIKKDYWITPFFVQLFGEYIYEMLIIFDKYLDQNMENCINFINENQGYWETTKKRMISYWNEYYRTKHPYFEKYLGKKIVEKINKRK